MIIDKAKEVLKIQRERFKDTPNILIADFIDFAGTDLLIVEDNKINQKVMISMLKKSKISFCPNDASTYIKEIVKVVCSSNGGFGAVREMI